MPSIAASLRARAAAWAAAGPAAAGYLLAAQAAVVGSGFVFWLAAGRLAPTAHVGASAGAIAVGMIASTLCQLGLPQGVLRYWRESPEREALAGAALTTLWLFTAAGGLIGAFIFQTLTATGGALSGATVWVALPLGAMGVAQATLVWVVASAAGRPVVAVQTSLAEAVLKVVLAAPLAAVFGADGILLGWAISLLLSSAAGAWLFLPRAAGARLRPLLPRPRLLAPIARFSLATYVGDFSLFTPTTGVLGWLVPAIVVARYGAEAGGVFYIAWSIAGGLNAIPFALATITVARAEHRGVLAATARVVALAAPPALAAALIAPLLLAVFGPAYRALGTEVLRTLALGALLVAANAALAAQLKLRGRTGALHLLGATSAVPTVIASVLLPVARGTEAVAVTWVLAQAAALLLALLAAAPARGAARAAVEAHGPARVQP